MKKLWQKDEKDSSKLVEDYCFSDGVALDNNLVNHDVYGSIAHTCALAKLKIITNLELEKLVKCLKEIIDLNKKGKFIVTGGDEDVHTKVEKYLTEKLGDLGKKIHTARSRNDQIAVDMRLYTKEELLNIAVLINKLTDTYLHFAEKYEFIPMPGYTHMQKAMPSSIGMWIGSFVESLMDDSKMLQTTYELNDQCPLGAGAAYGLSLPIDRELTAGLLGFSKVLNNSLYAILSRAKSHTVVMQSLVQVMLTLSRFAQDMLLFTTSEFNFFKVDSQLCTGSSIMPQKKNLDIMEFLRAKTHVVIGYEQMVNSISAGLPSGYNADFSETKGPLMKSIGIVKESLKVVDLLINSIKPNIEILSNSMTKELYATHAAYELVKKGIPFREAYVKIGTSLDELPQYNSQEILKMSTHTGGTGNLGLKKIQKDFSKQENYWLKEKKKYMSVINKLIA
ncbi:argininosuccinate lyase [Candidatus Roizmanbacteria bacterium]|nr:argininosuccinate lyase [Candidatus Roizmanbacteria bacterium]